jgi:hypothetical protein
VKVPSRTCAIGFLALTACAIDLARACWYSVEMLALCWVPPFLFGLVLGFAFAAVAFLISRTNPSSSGGKA